MKLNSVPIVHTEFKVIKVYNQVPFTRTKWYILAQNDTMRTKLLS